MLKEVYKRFYLSFINRKYKKAHIVFKDLDIYFLFKTYIKVKNLSNLIDSISKYKYKYSTVKIVDVTYEPNLSIKVSISEDLLKDSVSYYFIYYFVPKNISFGSQKVLYNIAVYCPNESIKYYLLDKDSNIHNTNLKRFNTACDNKIYVYNPNEKICTFIFKRNFTTILINFKNIEDNLSCYINLLICLFGYITYTIDYVPFNSEEMFKNNISEVIKNTILKYVPCEYSIDIFKIS